MAHFIPNTPGMPTPSTDFAESGSSESRPGDAPVASIIVVSFNTRSMTLDCLRSVYAETPSLPIELIVVDNASSDGSADAIAEEFPQATLIRSQQNLGFAGANNLAAGMARGEFVLLLNPDTLVVNRAVEAIIDFARARPECGIWGGRTLFADRSLNPTSCWRKFDLWTLLCAIGGMTLLFPRSAVFNPEAYGAWQRDSERSVDIITGCWLLARRSLWNDLGGFSSKYFMYGEDADLCLRARALGAKPAISPAATIVHFGGGADPYRPAKFIAIFKAKVSLIHDHWPRWQRPIGTFLYPLYPLVRAWGYGCAALVFRRGNRGERLGAKASLWREVWQRRSEWRHGFPTTDQRSAAASS